MFLTYDKTSINWWKVLYWAVVSICFCILSYFFLDKFIHIYAIKLNNGFWQVFTKFGTWSYLLSICIICYLLSFIHKFKHLKNPALYVFFSMFVAGIFIQFIKVSFGRVRPLIFDAIGEYGFAPFNFSDVFASMPSGHATTIFSALIMLGLIIPKYKIWYLYFAILIACSRIIVGAHYLSDIVMGAFIGSVMADIVFVFLNKHKKWLIRHKLLND